MNAGAIGLGGAAVIFQYNAHVEGGASRREAVENLGITAGIAFVLGRGAIALGTAAGVTAGSPAVSVVGLGLATKAAADGLRNWANAPVARSSRLSEGPSKATLPESKASERIFAIRSTS